MKNKILLAAAPVLLSVLGGCGDNAANPTKLTDTEKAKQIEALNKQHADEWKSTLRKK